MAIPYRTKGLRLGSARPTISISGKPRGRGRISRYFKSRPFAILSDFIEDTSISTLVAMRMPGNIFRDFEGAGIGDVSGHIANFFNRIQYEGVHASLGLPVSSTSRSSIADG